MYLRPVDFSLARRKSEIAIKTKRIRTMLEENSLEGVVFTKHPNFSWITAGGKNFVANCFDSGATAILITKTGMYALCSVIEAPRMQDEEVLEQLGFKLIVFGWEEDETKKHICEIVNPENVISDSGLYELKEASELITPLRLELTESEIERYHYLGDTMSFALEEYLLTVTPGMTELEIAGGISHALWKYEIESVMHLVTADERSYHYRHGLPTAKELKHNLIVSINGRYKGLIVTVSRMIHFGKPPEEITNRYRDCLDIECGAIAKMRAGSDELDGYLTLKSEYVKKGWPDMFERHGQGGRQGYFPRDYMITPQKHHIIKENQAYCFNPVIDGAKTEDSFLVKAQGIEFITKPMLFPKRLICINGMEMERPELMILS